MHKEVLWLSIGEERFGVTAAYYFIAKDCGGMRQIYGMAKG